MPYFMHLWTGARAHGWQLETLAVHPNHQGHGYGRELASWGLARAKEEGVPTSVVSSYGNEDFYIKTGFDVPGVIGNACDGEGNPLNGVKGGAILFKDPGV
jgi:GNAT superfamily N-acetyltransferase